MSQQAEASRPEAAAPAGDSGRPAPARAPSEKRIDAWSAAIKDVQGKESSGAGIGCAVCLLGIVAAALIIWLLREYSAIGVAVGVIGLVVGIVLWTAAVRRSREACGELAADILRTCEAESLSTPAVVEALWARAPKGDTCKRLLSELDPETAALLDIRGRVLEFFGGPEAKIDPVKIEVSTSGSTVSSVTLAGEKAVSRFNRISLDYLDRKAYVESIAALATLQSVCIQIAPPLGEILLLAADESPLKQVSISTHKVFSGFDYKPEINAVWEVLTRRRTQSLVQILLAAQQAGGDVEKMAQATGSDPSAFGVRDDVTVGACIDYLGKHLDEPFQQNKVAEVLALIPDQRILPYVIRAFGWLPFFPAGIDGVLRLGRSVAPQLLAAFKSGSGSVCFNTAMALGILDAEGARSDMEEMLPRLNLPVERIGCRYALVRADQTEHLSGIVDALGHADNDVRHAAAIALEHLPQPLDEGIFLKHLDDTLNLVRLRLVRKLGAQGTSSPVLWDALIARFEDADESVRSAAVDALARLDRNQIYDRVLPLVSGGSARSRICACQLLGRLSNPKALPVLADALKTAGDNDLRRAAISGLGDLGAVQALDLLGPYFKSDDLSNAAYLAALRIGLTNKEEVLEALRPLGREPTALVVRTLLGDEDAKIQCKGSLGPWADLKRLLGVLQFGMMLRDPDFEPALSRLIDYRKHANFPGDRYVSYMAVKALVGIKLAKAAEVSSGGGQA